MPEFKRTSVQDVKNTLRKILVGGLVITFAAMANNVYEKFIEFDSLPTLRMLPIEFVSDASAKANSVFTVEMAETDYDDYEFVNGYIATETSEEAARSPYATLFSDSYYELNEELLNYASKFATFDYHGITIDGLAVLAQANTESVYMCDITQSISALYPSKWLQFDSVDDIDSCCAAYVWAFGGLDDSNIKAWSGGGGVFEQGPLQQRIPANCYDALKGAASEYQTIVWSGLEDLIAEKCPQILSYCTGTDSISGANAIGDRYKIKDNCIVWAVTHSDQLERLWDIYYKDAEMPTLYEILAISAYSHWIPGVITGDNSSYRYFGFARDNAWFDLARGFGSDEGVEIIRKYVREEIDNNRSLYYDEGYDKDVAISKLSLAMFNNTDASGLSKPQRIYKEMVEAGIIEDLALYDCEYGMPHAQSYAIQYLYSYIMLEELLVNRY